MECLVVLEESDVAWTEVVLARVSKARTESSGSSLVVVADSMEIATSVVENVVLEEHDELGHERKVLKTSGLKSADHVVECGILNDQVELQGCPGYTVRCSLAMPRGTSKSESARNQVELNTNLR